MDRIIFERDISLGWHHVENKTYKLKGLSRVTICVGEAGYVCSQY